MYLFLLLQHLTNDTQRLQNFWLERNALIVLFSSLEHAIVNKITFIIERFIRTRFDPHTYKLF